MIRRVIERKNQEINQTATFDQKNTFDPANEIFKEIDLKINKENDELDMLIKKQKKFILKSLILYSLGAVGVILFNCLIAVSPVICAGLSLGYIILGNIIIQPIAKRFSSVISDKIKAIETLKSNEAVLGQNLIKSLVDDNLTSFVVKKNKVSHKIKDDLKNDEQNVDNLF